LKFCQQLLDKNGPNLDSLNGNQAALAQVRVLQVVLYGAADVEGRVVAVRDL
jgi:hypothetical protein